MNGNHFKALLTNDDYLFMENESTPIESQSSLFPHAASPSSPSRIPSMLPPTPILESNEHEVACDDVSVALPESTLSSKRKQNENETEESKKVKKRGVVVNDYQRRKGFMYSQNTLNKDSTIVRSLKKLV